MKIFFDTEFTGLHQHTTLISIGLVSEDGRSFYAESLFYDPLQLTPWINTNVISNLSGQEDQKYLTKSSLRKNLLAWLEQFDTIQFVSDVCHYDFVLLIDLLAGSALNLPSTIAPVCHDICYDISRQLSISLQEAFNLSRESLLEQFNLTVEGQKHHALYDAQVIKAIYTHLNTMSEGE